MDAFVTKFFGLSEVRFPNTFYPSKGKYLSELSETDQNLLYAWFEKFVLPHIDNLPDFTASIIKYGNG